VKIKSEEDELLQDVLGDNGEFREALFDRTIRSVRRQKQIRRAVLAASLFVLLAIEAFFLSSDPVFEPAAPLNVGRPQKAYSLIHSKVLGNRELVRTIQGKTSMIGSTSNHVELVETALENRLVREINEAEMLSLFSGHTVGIIHVGQNQPVLVLGVAGSKGFPVQ
jgi:hypothetical protein